MRITFHRETDRIMHRIEILENGKFVPVLVSEEGYEHDIWPCSPALQNVHLEPRNLGQVALLVGMAGVSHWSVSVEADVSRGRATFDIACRTTSQPKWLGTTYRRKPPLTGDARPKVRIEPAAGTPLEIEDTSHKLVLRVPITSGPLPRTIRWCYTVTAA